MSIDKRRKDLDPDRLKVAIAFGFGFSNNAAAEFGGVSESSAKRWKTDPEIVNVTEAVAACKSLWQSKNVKNAVSSAVESAEERIGRIFDRATRLTEAAVKKVEEMGDNASLEQLMEMHKQITTWAAKYRVSEAPKRMQLEGSQTHTHVHVLSLAEAGEIWARRKEIQTIGRPQIAGATNVIDVNAEN